jgi:hypothetical protein
MLRQPLVASRLLLNATRPDQKNLQQILELGSSVVAVMQSAESRLPQPFPSRGLTVPFCL